MKVAISGYIRWSLLRVRLWCRSVIFSKCLFICTIFIAYNLICANYAVARSWLKVPSLYEGCTPGSITNLIEFPEFLLVRTIGPSNYAFCQQECGLYFGLIVNDNGDVQSQQTNIQNNLSVNRDQVERCLQICNSDSTQTGSSSVTVRQYDASSNSLVTPYSNPMPMPVDRVASASGDSQHVYFSNTIVRQGDVVNVSTISSGTGGFSQDEVGGILGGEENAIYLCGYKTVYYYPYPYSTKSSTWNSTWSAYNTSGTYDQAQIDIPFTDNGLVTDWFVRKAHPTCSGIFAKDGDYLTIQYAGRIYSSQVSSQLDGKLFMATNSYDDSSLSSGYYGKSGVIGGCTHDPRSDCDPSKKCSNCWNNDTEYEQSCDQPQFFDTTSFNPVALTQSVPAVFLPNTDYENSLSDKCNFNSRSFYGQYVSGVLSGFSSDEVAPICIAHPFSLAANGTIPTDVVGGYNVVVSWKGCRYANGERLQYALVPMNIIGSSDSLSDSVKNYLDNSSNWYDLNITDSSPGVIEVNNPPSSAESSVDAWRLAFKIKLLSAAPGFNAGMIQRITHNPSYATDLNTQYESAIGSPANIHRYNTDGQYILSILKFPGSESGSSCSDFAKVILTTCSMMNGRDACYPGGSDSKVYNGLQEKGVTQIIYERIIKVGDFISAIRVLLILYIVWTGLSFMIGLAQITQHEGIIRCVKIGIVTIICSETSWQFFNTYLLSLFVSGMEDLIYVFSTDPTLQNTDCIKWMPVLSKFIDVCKQAWSQVVWIRIYALVLNGLIGFGLAIALIVGVIVFSLCILRALLIYLISVIVVGVLIVLAPLFLSFILFDFTKSMFDAWIKQLIVAVLQPVAVLASINLFSQMILILMQASLSFTVCYS